MLLVIDEAHRAAGNYAYCNVIEKLEAMDFGFRILALSATPVSKIENLQQVITSLRCSNLEVRDEEDEEIRKYTYEKDIQELVIPKDNHIKVIEDHLNNLAETQLLPYMKGIKILPHSVKARHITAMTVLDMN